MINRKHPAMSCDEVWNMLEEDFGMIRNQKDKQAKTGKDKTSRKNKPKDERNRVRGRVEKYPYAGEGSSRGKDTRKRG